MGKTTVVTILVWAVAVVVTSCSSHVGNSVHVFLRLGKTALDPGLIKPLLLLLLLEMGVLVLILILQCVVAPRTKLISLTLTQGLSVQALRQGRTNGLVTIGLLVLCTVCGGIGLVVGCFTSQQHASVSQGRICSDNFTCCHTEIEVAGQTFYLTQSQYTDTGSTSPSVDPITLGA